VRFVAVTASIKAPVMSFWNATYERRFARSRRLCQPRGSVRPFFRVKGHMITS
jgi:hypothetical protein